MLGVLLTALFAVLAAFAGAALVARWAGDLDTAERVGLAGLVGLGAAGMLTLVIGLLPSGLTFAKYVVGAVLLVLATLANARGFSKDWKFRIPSGAALLAPVCLTLIGLTALVGVLAPSLSTDWDTIAYHLAVPKLWLEAGQVTYIQGIHHSNFPSTIEMLFMLGLEWGGQSGAKAFSLMVYVFGCLAVFGIARRWYGSNAGWWAAIGVAGIPVVAWESGTGYIDVAHGLYATLGTLYAVEALKERKFLVLAGVGLGLALGTKYTGLQSLFAVLAVVGVAAVLQNGWKEAVRSKLTVALIALAIAAPWYIKTAVYTGNPVYPFFFNVLGGKDWDAWHAEVYTHEQKTFGVGTSPANIGHAVFGLAYQPGRYTNPQPDRGGGFPTGAIGFAALLAGVCAATGGRLRREERLVLAIVGLGFLMWFALSQQSRYLTMLAIPLVVLGAGQVTRVRWGPVVAGGFFVQALASLYVLYTLQTQLQLQVVTGKVSQDEYLSRLLPFYPAAKEINALPAGSKVALYDEVFGFYLDRSYFWANPGHSMLIPYRELQSGEEYAAKMQELGFTHLYINLSTGDQRFIQALAGNEPYSEQEREAMWDDLNLKWKVLLAEAANKRLIRDVVLLDRAALGEFVR